MTDEGRCAWCSHRFPAERLCGYEERGEIIYAHLCPGCYYCLHAGGPRVNAPFTAEKKQLEAFTRTFFAQAIKHG